MQIRNGFFLSFLICSLLFGFVHAETGEQLFEIGNAYFQKSQYKDAIQTWEKSIIADPSLQANARYNIGLAYAGMEQYEEAIKAWDITIKLVPTSPIAFDNKGTALAILGRNEEAISAYEEAIRLAPNETKYKADRDMLLNVMNAKKSSLSPTAPFIAILSIVGCIAIMRRKS